MRASRFNRLTVPMMANFETTSNAQPAIMCTAGKHPLRVVARSSGFAISVFLAFDSVQSLLDLASGIGSDVFELPPGASETFVLAPGQKLFAATTGVGAIVNFAISEALPSDLGDERAFAP